MQFDEETILNESQSLNFSECFVFFFKNFLGGEGSVVSQDFG